MLRRVRGRRADHGPGRVARERMNRPAVLGLLVVVARPRQAVAALDLPDVELDLRPDVRRGDHMRAAGAEAR